MELHGARVLLTGATGGIGHAIARTLAARGATQVVTGRRIAVLEPLVEELGGSARAVGCDLSDRAEVDRLLAEAGEIDILVANAALPASGAVAAFTPEGLDAALEVNLRAPMAMTHRLMPGMIERGRGHFVYIGSLNGKVVSPGATVYSATKFGLRAFAQGLRNDLLGTPVGVTQVFPSFIRDAGMFHDSGAKLPPGVATRSPQDVADAVVRGILKNRAEIDVAPVTLRAGTYLHALSPSASGFIQRKTGGELANDIATGQRKRGL